MLLWLIAWALIGLRSLGVIAALPTPGGGTLPVRIRVALSMMLAFLLVGVVPLPVTLRDADGIRLAMAAAWVGFAFGLVGFGLGWLCVGFGLALGWIGLCWVGFGHSLFFLFYYIELYYILF